MNHELPEMPGAAPEARACDASGGAAMARGFLLYLRGVVTTDAKWLVTDGTRVVFQQW